MPLPGGGIGQPPSPRDYIRLSCELHLYVTNVQFTKSAQYEIDYFLNGGSSSSDSNDTSSSDNSTTTTTTVENTNDVQQQQVLLQSNNNNKPMALRLFVWVPSNSNSNNNRTNNDMKNDDDNDTTTEMTTSVILLEASCQHYPSDNEQVVASIAFCRSSNINSSSTTTSNSNTNTNRKITHASQIHCITIQSPIVLQQQQQSSSVLHSENESNNNNMESKIDDDNNSSSNNTLKSISMIAPSTLVLESLQLYTRECFLPTLTSMMITASSSSAGGTVSTGNNKTDIVKDGSTSTSSSNNESLDVVINKIRELDVAIIASTRSARIPHVILSIHDTIASKVMLVGSSSSSGNDDTTLVTATATTSSLSNVDWDAIGLRHCLNDDTFLNTIQSNVSQWIDQIRQVTTLPSNTLSSSSTITNNNNSNNSSTNDWMNIDTIGSSTHVVTEEITFWTQLYNELQSIQNQLSSPGIELTIAMLRETKRFVATLALENNTGLDHAISITNDITTFIKHFPITPLQVAATSQNFDTIVIAMNAIFDYIPKIRQSRYYPLDRCVALISATTVVLRESILSILQEQFNTTNMSSSSGSNVTGNSSYGILFIDYKVYENKIRYPTLDIFVQFDDRYNEFKDFILDQARRRKISGMNRIFDQLQVHHHTILKERLDMIHTFRYQHEQLRNVVQTVLQDDEPETIQYVIETPYKIFTSSMINIYDLSINGTNQLNRTFEEYDIQMDALEERLARLLRDKLQACHDAEDMFRVFARFNMLLTRTRVRSAVKEFQMQLIQTVAVAIEKLQSKFTLKYEASPAARISRLRGIPPASGKILWAKQMERQVHTLMERMGNVLGPNWGQQLEGRQLRKSGDELLAKLDARSFFRNWVMEWEKELTAAATSKLSSFPIIIEPTGRSGVLTARVNFDEKSELLFREIRYLKWLGYGKDIPRTLIMVSDEAVSRYPFAATIKTALRSYESVRVLVTPELEPLVMPQLLEIRECISEAFDVKLSSSTAVTKKRRVRWDSKEMTEFVTKLSVSVTKFEDRVEQLLRACDKVDIALNLLEEIEYDSKKFVSIIGSIQKTIDEMSLSGYSELDSWIDIVSDKMAEVLAKRLEGALKAWNKAFLSSKSMVDETEHSEYNDDEDEVPDMNIMVSVRMEILLRNQQIMAVPAVPTIRSIFLTALHNHIGIVCNLPKPKGGRYEVFDTVTAKSSRDDDAEFRSNTFNHLVRLVPPKVVADAYSVIEDHIGEAAVFADQWLSYQILWDMQVADVAALVGSDIERWRNLLIEASEARATLDSSAATTAFGPITVSYGKVQSQINLKYDAWQRELQTSFASVLGQSVSEMYEQIVKAKTKLEETTLDTASTENVVLGVTFIQEMKQKSSIWLKEIGSLRDSEKILKRQRYIFHSDWMETSVPKGLYDSMLQILDRRSRTMEQQIPVLQARVNAEDKTASKQLKELLQKWHEEKPLRGNMTPNEANVILAKYEMTMKKAFVHQENLIRAKDALSLEHTIENSDVNEALSELADLKEVWDAMTVPYKSLEEIKDSLWSTSVMRKVRRGLDDLLASLRSLPNRIRQYDAYIQMNDRIKGYIAGHGFLSELKTDALKERHWKTIMQRLGILIPFSDLTVGILWDHGVLSRKKDIGEILVVAQGEMALEVFLTDIRDRWMKQELELVLFQNRTRLIKGWDDLFSTLDDHINGLALMKSSPYYRAVREFQEEGKLWEERLTTLRSAFDSWVDVQRRWVYLEGILFGSSDIKAQLPTEWSRFKSVDTEFISLMRRIASKPYAMEVLNIDNLQRTLERLGNLMGVIQRALGEYLSKQRSDFSRFYFLGDDDLLEIMGNSGEPGKVLSHVGKMFSGIAGARLASGQLPDKVRARLDAMVSKDGEVVEFIDPIDITDETNVKDWLKSLEDSMQSTLAFLLEKAVEEDIFSLSDPLSIESKKNFVNWTTKFPAQVMILAGQVSWSMGVDKALSDSDSNASLTKFCKTIEWKLEVMANTVLQELPPDHRKKIEQLITELVHQRDVVRGLIADGVSSASDFRWLYNLRYVYDPKAVHISEKLTVKLSNATFHYGFEYLGIGERLVQTPLTDRCYLTLTQALHFRMGGSPFGPAGTGKTESVKALGAALGRFVLVFNCDETFDFSAMGRLLAGLSQVGAWGCFDEFNRLEERILSAVSQQILTIQRGLIDRQSKIELLGRSIRLHDNVGIFITMNPGYEGRSNLPDNLKSLFRSFAMVVPDRNLIAQVMLYSQGIVTAEQLSSKVVNLFIQCEAKMSKQRHYDFGLRALKTLLVSAGALKRKAIDGKGELSADELMLEEKNALILGACNNVLPKLVADDMPVFHTILEEVFPGSTVAQMDDELARAAIISVCKDHNFVSSDNFIQKVLQLKQVIDSRHGIMVVGKTGKSAALKVLFRVLEKLDGTKGEMYIMDPKAMSKDKLYGSLDGTTLEWTDGVVTSLLRKIIDNQKGESDRRHWLVFDGDVDPEWAENLNSVLDDNKLLTLPSGERMAIPSNVRIILEVDSIAHATPATVSRCGMVWFSEDTVTSGMSLEYMLGALEKHDFVGNTSSDRQAPLAQTLFLKTIKPLIVADRTSSLVIDALDFTLQEKHVMVTTRERLINSFKALLLQGISSAIEYDENHPDFPMSGDHMEKFANRWLLHSLLWSFCGSASWDIRKKFSDLLIRTSGVIIPGGSSSSLYDYRVKIEDGEYELWSDSVPRMDIESHKAAASDVVITTTDTIRHSDVLGAWLSLRIPLILCGPPGSGKTMSLTSVLQSIQGVVVANLNFSSQTSPDLILKTFAQYCNYVRRGKDVYMEPVESFGAQSWLVIFCDEVNLPEEDSYGTQRVIMFMRQLIEHGGFWRGDNVWVKLNRVQFVGACNPPTDAGRVEMSHRFLRHVPLLLVDFPARDSLMQIYRTFNGGMMKLFPNLKGETNALTEAMVEVYLENQARFRPDMQPQYFYSPRELSRWVRGIYEATVNIDQGLTREELVRIWAHEGLRLFADRLVDEEDRQWCSEKIDSVARQTFAAVDFDVALARPMFYSTWLSKDTKRVDRSELKAFLGARLRVFYEEELDVPLVVFDGVLEHVLRIDRVLRQPMGHMLLVGDSGAGKTVLSKFVSWMNGLSIYQIKAHSRYGIDNFNEDLRGLMRRVGVDGEKVCFIFDEANALSSGFIEAINALLASGEVPGLFEGDEYTALISGVRESAVRDGVILDSEDEIWRHFTSIVQRNLHVVFTLNPSGGDWKNRSTTSPALFNRCVVDWFGTWDNRAMAEVGKEFTQKLDMGDAESIGGAFGVGDGASLMKQVESVFEGNNSLRQAVVAALVSIHQISIAAANEVALEASSVARTFLSPRDYIALIQNFVACLNSRRETVEDEQLHVNSGLDKLRQTQENVAELKVGLGSKTAELREKEALANQKLQEMVADQNAAEKQKAEAVRISAEVEKQQKEINIRKDLAQRDLDQAEPALRNAQASVRGIKKRDLDEVRNLARPPNNVKLTLELVAIMLGETKVEWADVRKMLSKADFIPAILEFDADKLSQKQIDLVTKQYLDGNPDLTEESVTRSSKACGPLYKWAESMVKYSTIYNNIQPLRDEVAQLETAAKVIKDEKEKLEEEVARLEASIATYKVDYATLIRDVEALKSEMNAVTTKIDRAESLLTSLGRESERWTKTSETFQMIMRNLVGDGLLMAAFLTYAGFFDFKTRSNMMIKWQSMLESLGVEFREDLGIVESLSTGSQRLHWIEDGLPSDRLSIENGVILDHSTRFPLVIDPSGQAINYLLNKHKEDKIQTTSFLDKAFAKTLAGAIRFGTALLVENVEQIDPILNPILNRELQRTGGRTLVRIGTEEVDYSPKFKIILSTKNPAVRLTPDLCSRVTLVNFTVTPDSLQSQSLSVVVQSMKPEIETQRAAILKLQGEQNVKLRELEDQMLAKISACEGSILDDDAVVEGMEILMVEGAQVEEQIASSDKIMREVHEAVARFEPFATICRNIYVLLESMRHISFLYEFTAKTFMRILDHILDGSMNKAIESIDETSRIETLKKLVFHEIAARIGRGLQVEDQMVFSILLSRIQTGDMSLIDANSTAQSSDELIHFITNQFGSEFPWQGRSLGDLLSITTNDISCHIPLLLCSAPGHDVSGRIESMAREVNKELASVAMGSSEGYDMADSYIGIASKRGTWVLLKNVHLCVDWLRDTLVKKVQSFGSTIHPDFRLFITSEINPRLPTGLLQVSDVIVAQAPTGIKASLYRFISSISKDRLLSSSPIRNRLYLLLGWVHSVIQERLRFVPSGWTEAYEWTEADANHALDVIDALLLQEKNPSDPEKLPWDAIRSTLRKGVYGGRITELTDQSVLDELVNTVFVPKAYDVGFQLVSKDVGGGPLLVPEECSREQMLDWITTAVPSRTPPSWIGLNDMAEIEREQRTAKAVIEKVQLVQEKCNINS